MFDTIKNRYSGADTFDTELHVEEEAGQTALTMNINNADIQAVDAPVVMVGVEEGVKNAEAPETSDIIGQPDGVLDVHHVHLWSLDGNSILATLHAQIERGSDYEEIRHNLHHKLEHLGIHHATIEFEYEKCKNTECVIETHHHHCHNH